MNISLFVLVIGFMNVLGLNPNKVKLATEYFSFKNAKYLCYFSCESQYNNIEVIKGLAPLGVRTSVRRIEGVNDVKIEKLLNQWNVGVGALVDGSCDNVTFLLQMASELKLFDAMHVWLVFAPDNITSEVSYIEENFQHLNLSVNSDVVVVSEDDRGYKLSDVFNFGKIQGNSLEITSFGSWRPDTGLNVVLKGYKYYQRWDFHNLTLRAISVVLNPPKVFYPELLTDLTYYPGIRAFTKINSQLLVLLKEKHNLRFNYTVTDRWVGSPERNSTLAVTNSLYWGEQDISSTGTRMYPKWLGWADVCFPPATYVETKFFYLMPDKGVGDYENRFLAPMSRGVWWSTLAACALCAAVLAAAARLEVRPGPGWYAFFSVSAAICQQDFVDGVKEERPSQGRKLTLLVVGVTSMLLYNYYTSSVVSWLLSAAPPSIDSIDQLRESSLELIFEDVGYTRQWLENPGFYYYTGYSNPKEDELRDKKLYKTRRTVQPLQTVTAGVNLIRTGEYAYHTEPYTVSQVISKTFNEEELCELGALQMMPPSYIYILVQKGSPYKEFVVWSLLRLFERGHYAAARGRFPAAMPECSGRHPRALALGQAAPAFLMLLQFTVVSILILIVEILWHRYRQPALPRWSR